MYLFCKQTGCDGVVIGLLHADGTVDKARTKQLVELAYPMGVTFHRAFDRAINPLQALEDIIETGCERILTSGQKPQAIAGAELISTLIQKADNRIVIMPGSGVRSDNIAELVKLTGADCFHSSARKMIASQMTYSNPHMNETLQSVSLDEAEVKAIIAVLENLV
jgi:copper homeostasis protein